jgi:Ca-activated chloride channel family protein
MKALAAAAAMLWASLWLTPDQQGQHDFDGGEFAKAAAEFRDPMWQGAAWYRAGEFGKAAAAFARRDTAEAHFNEGNARLMLGKYEAAIACYDRALELREGWLEAAQNRALAQARAELVARTGGEMGDQKIGADEIVFDKQAGKPGEETELAGAAQLSDEQIQALWLRRVQTRPADFLRAKFAYQLAATAQDASP